MAQNSSPHWISELFKDRFIKIVIKFFLSALTLFVVFILCKALFGYHVSILGFDINSPIPKTDTFFVNTMTNKEIKKSSDSTTVPQKQHISPHYLTLPIQNKFSNKDTLQRVHATVTGNDNKTVIGNNNGILGNVTINNGLSQRHVTPQYATMFLNRLADTIKANNLNKNVLVHFGSTMGSDESITFTNEICNLLIANGYTNLDRNVGPTMGNNELRVLYLEGKIFIDVGMKAPQ